MKRAFTLIELLIVIAIISVLAAILFPVFSRVRASARTTTCLSNLHQLGIAVHLYTTDYDELYPYGLDPATRDGIGSAEIPWNLIGESMPDLREVMQPYVRNQQVYVCPSEYLFDYQTKEGQTRTLAQQFGCSYRYFYYPAMLRIGQNYFEKPAEAFLMGDTDFWHGGDDFSDGRLNELFADYHTKNVTWQYYLTTIQTPE